MIRKSRYTDAQLISLGYSPEVNKYSVCLLSSDAHIKRKQIVLGAFANVINVLFSSSDGSLDNNINSLVTENCPPSVRTFLEKFLCQPVKPLPSAPDAATAFDLIIPRSVQSSADLAPYIDNMRTIVKTAMDKNRESSEFSTK